MMGARSGLAAVTLVLVLVGAACGGGDTDEGSTPSNSETESTYSSSTVEPTGGAEQEPAGEDDNLPARGEPAPPFDISVVEVEAVNDRVRPVTVYYPDERGPWPTAVLFAGNDSPRSTLDPFARQLAAEGLAVATVDYEADRLLSGDYECDQRFATLAAWEHGGDPDGMLITGGHSLGASVATMASLFEPFIEIATGQPLDCGLDNEDKIGPTDLVVGMAGAWHPAECEGQVPMTAIGSSGFPDYVLPFDGNPGVPFIVAHGTEDGTCSFAQAEDAASEWEAGGHPTELLALEGAGHSEGVIFVASDEGWPEVEADPDSVTSRAVVDAIVARADSQEGRSASDAAAETSDSVEVVRDVVYLGSEDSLGRLDIYRPGGNGPWPVVVAFHGGTAAGKDDVPVSRQAQAMAEAGLLVYVPNWNDTFASPTTEIVDRAFGRAACALVYAEATAAEHGGAPSVIVTVGGSAGAQPAAWLAVGHIDSAPGCVATASPSVPAGAVLIDSEYFLHTTVFQPMFDNELAEARRLVAGFTEPTQWAIVDSATFRFVVAEDQTFSRRPIDDPGSTNPWLTQRDPDGVLTADLETLGALDDDAIDHDDEARLLAHRLEAAGADVRVDVFPGDHTAVIAADPAKLLTLVEEITGT